MNDEKRNNVEMISIIYPYVVNTLKSVKGKRLVVDTVRDSTTGYLIDVKPDHIVVRDQQDDPTNLILISQIVSIMVIGYNNL